MAGAPLAAAGLAWGAWPDSAVATSGPATAGLVAMLGLLVVAGLVGLAWLAGLQRRRLVAQAARLAQQAEQLQALARDEQLLRQAEQLAQLGSYDWNPVTGALHWSEGHFRLWGLQPGALKPDYDTFRRGIHPDDLASLEARLQHSLASAEPYEFSHRVQGADGVQREVLARGEAVRGPDGRVVRLIGTVQDITRRREAEARLQMQAFVLDSITDPVSVVDTDRVYRMVNRAWCRASGFGPEDVVGRPPGDLHQRVASTERDAALQRCLAGAEVQVLLAEVALPGSGRRWWETTMFPLTDPRSGSRCAALVSRDVSARQAAAQALEESVDNLRLTLNTTGDAIFASAANAPDEPLLFVNDRLLQLWGIPPEQAASLTPAGVMAAARRLFIDPAREEARVAEVIASQTMQEDRLSLNDGRVLLRRCIPARQGGRQVRVWGFRDITVESRALAGLRAAEAQQRALLTAFPGYIACIDANQRCTFVNSRLASLLAQPADRLVGQGVPALAGPERGPQVARLVARALDGEVVSFEHGHPATDARGPVHLLVTLARGLDRSTGETQCYAFGTDITPQKKTEAALLAAKDDAERAHRDRSAFLSSLSQALHSPMSAVLSSAQQLLADSPGLAPHHQAQVHQILLGGQQLRALSERLAQQADDPPGPGSEGDPGAPSHAPAPAAPPPGATAFTTLPPTTPHTAPDTATAAQAIQADDAAPLPVLYIDDNPVNTLLMAAMFERLKGLQLHCEHDPASGVARARAAPPALLLVDIQMPGLDGFEVLRQLRQGPTTREVPAIAVSANAMAQDVARGRAAGFADYLTKPLEMSRLLAAIQAALPGWTAPPDGSL